MLLTFDHVTGTGKGFHLKNIHFGLPAGYIMGLAGKNGAGKSTLIDYIMNPKKKYSGSILLNGTDIHTNHTNTLKQIGFISETNEFFMNRTVAQNAELLGMFYPTWDMDLFRSTKKRLELPNHTLHRLSRGEYIKFQLAFAIAHRPSLYLLDEATAGMDPVFRIDFFQILQSLLVDEHCSILMTTHISQELERKTDYIGIMESGSLISFGEALL